MSCARAMAPWVDAIGSIRASRHTAYSDAISANSAAAGATCWVARLGQRRTPSQTRPLRRAASAA